ncbi:hypothetical protein Syun_004310 [Stephania yunnanensis]|uniref:Uncharacterized protein n=1 Tax=Stephania yunnanensis TaxID=152371 RepID=A0AAP0L2U2_9MAGN
MVGLYKKNRKPHLGATPPRCRRKWTVTPPPSGTSPALPIWDAGRLRDLFCPARALGIEAYKSSHKTTPEYRQKLKDYMISNGDYIYEDGWNKSVTHLRQWYPITDEEAADTNLMDSTPNEQVLMTKPFKAPND